MPQKQPNDKEGGHGPPAISLPKGGGAIRGIGEKFQTNPVTGTGALTVPIFTSPGRSGFGPKLSLSYDSGSGNGPFGFGWNLSLPAITRKTDKGLPKYRDAEESDVYILSGAEDLVPFLQPDGTRFEDDTNVPGYVIHRYRPRIEGLFARIERWTNTATGEIHWRSITRDNVTTLYGKDNNSRVFDPADPDPAHPTRIFSWLICESYDDKGNAIVYEYAEENDDKVDHNQINERNRVRTANRYLKRIRYGNRTPRQLGEDLSRRTDWLFEVIFDYDEGYCEELPFDDSRPEAEQHRLVKISESPTRPWAVRPDPFSTYRAGFEIRTYRRCCRVLMFHCFDELGEKPYLVRSTEFNYSDLKYDDDTDIVKELTHQGSTRFASFISSVTQCGYVKESNGKYLKKSFPPLEFSYSKSRISEEIQVIDEDSVENLPNGLDGSKYRWVDLDGESISGILTEQASTWYFKPNKGEGRFGPLEKITIEPSLAALNSGQQQLIDLAGDGQLDLVQFVGPVPGFYERTQEDAWSSFRAFRSLPNIDWHDPNLRMIDLNGDGHADILVTEDLAFVWYPSEGEDGFGPAEYVQKALDEEKGPRLVFADGTQSIYLADMSGDGLTDLVRIRNGEVCYWPNLGYGHFGAKVTMDNGPWLDAPDQFDQRRIRLADVDGSGTTDILYLSEKGIIIWFNRSGNSWSGPYRLNSFPKIDNLSSVTVLDLLGKGTACIVWSSPLPSDTFCPMRYVDLMADGKPHLLNLVKNNMGAEIIISYAPSTKFYLRDKANGKPWFTRLPFPVHVVERVETYDHISRNRFVTHYAYHHGYFDGEEREFRGFGMVEQWDTEKIDALTGSDVSPSGDNWNAVSNVPPVYTKTWFHTGVYLGRERVSNHFAGLVDERDVGEYYREPGLSDAQARDLLLPDTVLPEGLTPDEEREACRALKGSMLRQEVYALDGTDKEPHPYSVLEQNFTVRWMQPRGHNRHAVFFTHPRETITYHYERSQADPRIQHALTLEVDDYGNVLKQVTIGYGRRPGLSPLDGADREKQEKGLITYTENSFTNTIDELGDYRTPLPAESRTYELTGFSPASGDRFSFEEWTRDDFALLASATEIPYEQKADETLRQKRLIESVRTLYRKDDLTKLQPLGELQKLALPGETYTLAFTPGLIDRVYRRDGQVLLPNPAEVLGGQGPDQGGYVDLERNGHWWIPSGRLFYSPNPEDTPAQELAEARAHFFLPRRFQDPFGQNTTVTYDDYDLLLVETEDALGNRVTAGERDTDENITRRTLDYRVLRPCLVSDPNRNRSAVAFDALGMVVGTAVMGKPEEDLGDSLEGFMADLTEGAILQHLANPLGDPHAILGHATTRLVYDLFAYHRTRNTTNPQPAVVYTLARETHKSDLNGQKTKIQHSFSYSDGFGREIQKKIQAEPGPVPVRDAEGNIIVGADGQPQMTADEVSPRWVGSGWTIFNNKGKPVRQYEPFFTDTYRFEFEPKIGVSPVLFYDPLERVVATLHPNHTWEKVVFDPWQQETWDVNDTILLDPQSDPLLKGFVLKRDGTPRLATTEYQPSWHALRTDADHATVFEARYPDTRDRANEMGAARKTEVHAGTPTVAYFDTLGRTFLTVAHNRWQYNDAPQPEEGFYATRVILDIEGNQREVIDAKGRLVMRYTYHMAGPEEDEEGNRRDTHRIHQASMEAGARWILRDVAGNPIRAWDSRGFAHRMTYDALRRPTDLYVTENGVEHLVEKTVYGESQGEAKNHCNRVYKQFDQAGVVTNIGYDFKGNLLERARRLARGYKTTLDWSGTVPLEPETYTSSTRYDALNRPVELKSPDNSLIRPGYNEANLLEKIEANLKGAEEGGELEWTAFVTNIGYNARGQRKRIDYGNGVSTFYTYDPRTFRLVHLETRRNQIAFPGDCPQPPQDGWPGCQVQNLHYTYDPVGNITHIRDDAQQTIYFRNRRVEPSSEYTYDAIYRLIEATGREHLGQTSGAPIPHSYNDAPRVHLPHPGDGNAMGRYLERYIYDEVGNFLEMQHRGTDPEHPGWTRTYAYQEPSLIEPGKVNNRLSRTTVGNGNPTTETYAHDAHGNMLRMPHLQVMQWDFKDQLHMTQRQKVNDEDADGVLHHGERTWYVYDSAGQRVRKVTERQAAPGETSTRMKERIYLGGIEIYREYNGNGTTVTLERETLHIMDDQKRIALVETRTQGNDPAPQQLIRYQFGNHLGSVSLELDDQAQIISYEEYSPYGSTVYQAVDKNIKATAKRYRYTGKERDEETGLNYHSARYYAPWLARWCNTDPAGTVDGTNLYLSVRASPLRLVDPNGLYSWGEFWEDVKAGVAGAARGVVEPSLIVIDFGQMGAALVTHAITEDPEDLNVRFLSSTGRRIAAADNPDAEGLRAGLVLATAMPTGGASVLIDNIATVFERDMEPDEARRFLVRGAVGQVVTTGLGAGISRVTGSGWTGRGSSAGDQVLVERIVTERATNGETSTGRGGPSGRTYAAGRTARGRMTPVRRSPAEGGDPHAEPQVLEDVGSLGGRTIVADQVPCPRCGAQLGAPEGAQPGFLQSRVTGSLRVITPRRASNPSSSPKPAAIRAAHASKQGGQPMDLIPNLEFVVPFAPPLVPFQPSPSMPQSGLGNVIDTGTGVLIPINDSNVFIPDDNLLRAPIMLEVQWRF